MTLSPELRAKAAAIKLFVTDVDGVWTDGRVTVHADGSESATFSVQDGLGISRLIAAGIEIVIISGRDNPAVRHRANRLGVQEVIMGSTDKGPLIERVCSARGLEANEIAVIGDDLPDLELFAVAGLSFAPPGAVSEVRTAADIVTTSAGGHGSLRQACDILLEAITSLKE
ncbi:MAG: hypothetical protein COB96_00650 [Planctomycetota bacterium]|nr:MAG: hypothetical protein COB96_00650 [Planctomycetota bacterium]